MLIYLVLLPLIAGTLCFFITKEGARKNILLITACLHFLGVLRIGTFPSLDELNGFLGVDALGKLILMVVSILFLMVSVYSISFLSVESKQPNKVFICCLLFLLAAILRSPLQ